MENNFSPCSVHGCRSSITETTYAFFELPQEFQRRVEWLRMIGRIDLLNRSNRPDSNFRVCTKHFGRTEVSELIIRRLQADAVPTRNIPTDTDSDNVRQRALEGKVDASTQTCARCGPILEPAQPAAAEEQKDVYVEVNGRTILLKKEKDPISTVYPEMVFFSGPAPAPARTRVRTPARTAARTPARRQPSPEMPEMVIFTTPAPAPPFARTPARTPARRQPSPEMPEMVIFTTPDPAPTPARAPARAPARRQPSPEMPEMVIFTTTDPAPTPARAPARAPARRQPSPEMPEMVIFTTPDPAPTPARTPARRRPLSEIAEPQKNKRRK